MLSLILWALIVIVTLKYVADPAARRQQRRGRHAGADGAGATRARRSSTPVLVLLGIVSARAVLRRRHHHAGAVGALGGRRPEDRDAGVRALRRADHGRDPDRAVRRAVARHRARSRPSSARSRWSGSSPSRSPASGTSRPNPAVLARVQSVPWRAAFCSSHGVIGLLTLGAVFLAVTGAEALYADLGHFGRRPIQVAWLVVVLPALALNYLGQGALVLADPEGDRESVLPALSGMGAAADGRARDRRDRDRQPGRHHRRLFAHPAGDPARPAAAARDPPHLGDAGRPDLHAARQLRCCWSACCCWSCCSARRARWRRPMASPSPARWW